MTIAALIACSGLLLAGQESSSVTMTCRGERVADVVNKVADQTGLKLSVGTVADDRVIVRVNKADPKVFLENLAEALGAVWLARGDGVLLERRPSELAGNAAILREGHLKALKASIASQIERLAAQSDWSNKAIQGRMDDAIAQSKKVNNRPGNPTQQITVGGGYNPIVMLLREALVKMPIQAWIGTPGERRVYATSANSLQVSLPYQPSVGAYLDARARLLNAVSKLPSSDFVKFRTSLPRETEKVNQVGKVLVRVNYQPNSAYADILVASPKGEVLGQLPVSLSGINLSVVPPGISAKVTFSPESLKLARVLASGNTHPSASEYDSAYPYCPWQFDKATQEVLPILEDPVAHEPLSYMVSDGVLGIADSMKRDVIAFMSDQKLANLIRIQGDGTYLANRVMAGCRMRNTGTTLVIGPLDLASAVQSRVDRSALKDLIAKVKANGYLRLKDLVDYSKSRDAGSAQNDLDFWWLNGISRNLLNQLATLRTPSLRLYRTCGWDIDRMSPGQQDIPMSEWTAGTRAELQSQIRAGRIRAYRNGATELENNEPTESSTFVMAENIKLRLQVGQSTIVFAKDMSDIGRFLQPYQLGYRLNPSADLGNGNNYMPRRFKSYLPARFRTLNITFQYSFEQPPDPKSSQPGQTRGRTEMGSSLETLTDVSFLGDKEMTLDELPKEIKQQVTSVMKAPNQGLMKPNQQVYRPPIPP